MILAVNQFDGEEWQAFVIQLLYLRYGANLIEVPDRHKGDCGIEAFASDGCAFQCYSPEGPSSIAETAAKHKKKVSRDIKKFTENRSDLIKVFGKTKIRRWILVVPDHCSVDVVQFCQKKTHEIVNLAPPLPYATDDFQIVTVNGHHFFASEIAELNRTGGLLVEAAELSVAPAEVHSFAEQHGDLVETMDKKLSKLKLERTEQDDLLRQLLQAHLEGGNAITYYDNKFPVISDRIRALKQARAKALEIDSKIQSLTIAGTREKFELELVNSVPALGRQTAVSVSYAAVAEWLMVCPLNPKG
jgi:hypothetical protein